MEFETYGLVGLFVSAATSATILPGSSEAVLAFLLIKGHPWLSCLFIASVGNTIGGMISYGLGRMARWSWIEKMGVKESDVRKLKQRVQRWGSMAGLLAWLPIIGDVVMVGLGYFRVKAVPVVLFSFVGRLIRYLTIVYVTLLVV
jgi:membrane protein YqaA with SNARE-associated domain